MKWYKNKLSRGLSSCMKNAGGLLIPNLRCILINFFSELLDWVFVIILIATRLAKIVLHQSSIISLNKK